MNSILARVYEALIALVAVALALEVGVVMMRAVEHRNDPEVHESARRTARRWTYGITTVVLLAFVGLAIGWGVWPLVALLVVAVPLVLFASYRKATGR